MGSRASQVKGRARSGARASGLGFRAVFFFFLGGGGFPGFRV